MCGGKPWKKCRRVLLYFFWVNFSGYARRYFIFGVCFWCDLGSCLPLPQPGVCVCVREQASILYQVPHPPLKRGVGCESAELQYKYCVVHVCMKRASKYQVLHPPSLKRGVGCEGTDQQYKIC